jgi:hypothetical protein
MKFSSVLCDACLGLLGAGVIVGGLAPMLGPAIGPGFAVCVAAASIVGAVVTGRVVRRYQGRESRDR